jgi:hypothetical protein
MRVPVITDGNGRSGRDAGNNGFRIDGGREGDRVGEVGDARGDETSGRDVLSEMDMVAERSVDDGGWWIVKLTGYVVDGLCTRRVKV